MLFFSTDTVRNAVAASPSDVKRWSLVGRRQEEREGRDRAVKGQRYVSIDSRSKVSKKCLLRSRAREGEGVDGVTPRTKQEWKACCNRLRIV